MGSSPEISPCLAPELTAMQAAAERLQSHLLRTPLLPWNGAPEGARVFLKLENLQAIGSYKIRSVGHALLAADPRQLQQGVYTASSGNAGLALAWMSRRLGLEARVYTTASSPRVKLDAMRACGARVLPLTDDDWWQVVEQRRHPTDPGYYVDAVRDPAALAGNGSLGLELTEQLPDIDTIIAPFGGGGVACGVAAGVQALRPAARLILAESTAAAPAAAALAADRPVTVPMLPSFISGAGAPCVLPEMWPLVRQLVASSKVVEVVAVAAAVRALCQQHHVIGEGAGALPLAALMSMSEREVAALGTTVCLVTGGNIDTPVLTQILRGEL